MYGGGDREGTGRGDFVWKRREFHYVQKLTIAGLGKRHGRASILASFCGGGGGGGGGGGE